MAIIGQEFVKFEGDSFIIKYTVTDATTSLSGWRVWWGMTYATSYSGITTGNTLQRRSGTWVNDSNCPATSTVSSNVTAGGVTVGASFVEITINYGNMENFTPTGGFNSDGKYLYELVLSQSGGQCRSIVAASGFMDVRQALFNSQDYRGDYP